nr:MAG TPA: hypothetical protein [Caudoviricetes sp.]
MSYMRVAYHAGECGFFLLIKCYKNVIILL